MEKRANFGSKIGAILAAAGSAVGLGNIWRFPYETGAHGGAAFILIYLFCILLLGIPVMIAEFSIGRHAKASTGSSYKVLVPGTAWKYLGYWGVLTGFLIFGYYTVVAGWTLEYLLDAGLNEFVNKTPQDFINDFQVFSEDPIRPLIWLFIFMMMTHFIIVKGVQKGIEKFSKVMMPILFVLLIVLAFCSVSLPNSIEGLKFLFMPDFRKIDGATMLSACGQTFFSLSLGMGCLSTYASYFSKDTKLVKTAFSVGVIDTMVAILAGVIIFPAAISVGIQPDAGPSLIFITLPNVFQQAFSGAPIIAYLFSVMFYVLLALAALTSTISMHEVSTAFIHEQFHFTRGRSASIMTGGSLIVGICASLSLGVLKDFTILNMGIFGFLDFLTAKIMLPLGGFFIAIFVGWYWNKQSSYEEITNGGTVMKHFFKGYMFVIKYIAPLGILFVFANGLGFI